MENKIFTVHNLSFSYEDKQVLNNLSLTIKENKITTLLGGNGCGKSTLFYLLSKNQTPQSGKIQIYDTSIDSIQRKEFARTVAIVHQNNTAPDDITVEKLVSYGRLPYKGFRFQLSKEDEEKIDWAMKITNVYAYKDRTFNKLSGGQKQRVWIALALAQDTKVLLLDEPTTYLDIRYQVDILQLVKKLNIEHNITIVMVLHDINQAIHYSDELIIMDKTGTIIAQGNPFDCITSDIISTTYGMKLPVIDVDDKRIVLAV